MAGALPVLRCPACGSERARALEVGPVALRRCRGCGLVHATEVDDPADVYSDDYLTASSAYGPDTTDPVVVAIGRAAAGRRLELLERRISAGTLLDVGCGSGEALDIAVGRGWAVIGVEPVPASAARAAGRGHDVRVGTIDEVDLGSGGFDAVVASHVLEHVLDPVGFLGSLAGKVRPGGALLVEVPNWSHRTRRHTGPDWDQLCPGEHVSHFTPKTLRATMRRAGLRASVESVTVVERTPLRDRIGTGFALVGIAGVPG